MGMEKMNHSNGSTHLNRLTSSIELKFYHWFEESQTRINVWLVLLTYHICDS